MFRITLSKTIVLHDFKVYNLSLQFYNLGKFLKIVQSCTEFLGVAGPRLNFKLYNNYCSKIVRIQVYCALTVFVAL